MSKIVSENISYEKFQENLKKMQLKEKGQRGFIIVGTTKNGKTCIFCAATGIKVRKYYNDEVEDYRLQPEVDIDQQNQKKMVNQGPVSTTQHPNVRNYKYLDKQVMIIDMPGHSDNLSFRKLCNFYYIREMALKLKKFRFLIVLNIQNETSLSDNNIDMLKNFTQMFKSAQHYVTLCVNKSFTLEKNIVKEIVRKQMKQKLDQKTFGYYSYAFQNDDFYIIPQARLMKKDYLQIPHQIIHLIRDDHYKQKTQNEFGSLRFNPMEQMDRQIQQRSKVYCQKAYEYIKTLIKTLFILANNFIKFFLKKQKVQYEKILQASQKTLKFDVQKDNSQVYSELVDRIKIDDQNQFKDSPMKKRRSYSKEDNNLKSRQYDFTYLEIILTVFEGPFKMAEFMQNKENSRSFYQELINTLIESLRQITRKYQREDLLTPGKFPFQNYLNSLSLINIRKWKQINFLSEAIESNAGQISLLVAFVQDYIKKGMQNIGNSIRQIISIVHNMVQNQYKEDLIVKGNHSQMRQIIQLTIFLCSLTNEASIQEKIGRKKNQIIQDLKRKTSFFDINPIINSPENTKKEALQKIQKCIQAFQIMRGNKLQSQPIIPRQLQILAKIGDLFEKNLCFQMAIEFYKILHYNNKIKRCVDKIKKCRESSLNYQFYAQWGSYFAQELNFNIALDFYQTAKQKTFKEEQLLQIHKRIVLISKSSERQKLIDKFNDRYVKNDKMIFCEKKLNEKLKKSKQECQKYLSEIVQPVVHSRNSLKLERFKNYLDISNIKGQINKLRNELR